MTITYPRALPENEKMQECWIDILDNIAVQPSGRGSFVNLSEVNDPVWRGTFLTGILEREVRPVWSAWRKSLRGGMKTFVAYDVRHSRPLAYPTANASTDISGAWAGTATVVAVAPGDDRSQLSLSGLPTTYQFKAGDRIGLEQSGHYGYYEIIEDKTASAGAAIVTVAPFLHNTIFTTSAVCRIWRPLCQFIIENSSWSEQGTVEKSPISFNGIQRL